MLPVAVYGTLKKGKPNHRIIEGSYTGEPKRGILPGFEMRNVRNIFPFIRRADGSTVHVEVYDLDPVYAASILRRLDMLEGYSPKAHVCHYIREQVNVVLEDGTTLAAWVYTGDRTNQQASEYVDTYARYDLIPSGSW